MIGSENAYPKRFKHFIWQIDKVGFEKLSSGYVNQIPFGFEVVIDGFLQLTMTNFHLDCFS